MKYLFGPVASRRLGLSLGVDLLEKKHCNLNCVYCELGRTEGKSLSAERGLFVKTQDVAAELEEFFKNGGKADVVTFSGAGEPTLALNLKEMILAAKKISPCKVAVLTNGVLLYMPEVRDALNEADIVVPSFDAATKNTFLKVNRPAAGVDFDLMLQGLKDFCAGYKGRIFLEILLVEGINDSLAELFEMRKFINSVENIEKIQLNTVARAGAEEYAKPVDADAAKRACLILGPKAEAVSGYSGARIEAQEEELKSIVYESARLRPVSAEEVSAMLNVNQSEAQELLWELEYDGLVNKTVRDGIEFFIGKHV
ncbi:MAG: radical SAM protein [Candidatus Goldbacteria bacterium]|nr:radical SAM protein [Candidatus Goldiibacteriota bacterium]